MVVMPQWGAVRKAEREYILADELGASVDHVRQLCAATEGQCGQGWALANPVVRIVRVEIREVGTP